MKDDKAQRKVNVEQVAHYAAAMKEGDWQTGSAEPVTVDAPLRNRQDRLFLWQLTMCTSRKEEFAELTDGAPALEINSPHRAALAALLTPIAEQHSALSVSLYLAQSARG